MNELPDDEYRYLVQKLNKEQKEFFYHILHLIKTANEAFYCFLSGGASVGKKSHVTKALYQAALKYYNSRPGVNFAETKVLMLAPVSTKQRPKTEDQRQKTKDRKTKTKDRRPKTEKQRH